MNVDKRWFIDRLEDRGLSQRALARHLGIDPSAVTLILKGRRDVKVAEAATIAILLHQPLEEVCRRLGVQIGEGRGEGKDGVPVQGYINQDGVLIIERDADYPSGPRPPELPSTAVAFQARTAESHIDRIDGWLLYTNPVDDVPPDAIGRMCLVTVPGDAIYLRYLKRGYRPGTYNLAMPGLETIESAEVSSAWPILWIRT